MDDQLGMAPVPVKSLNQVGSWSIGRFAYAILTRDADELRRLCEADPKMTLYNLDSAMRGFFISDVSQFAFALGFEDDAPEFREWVTWLREQDLLLRRHLGWSQRDVDLTVLRAAYRAGDLTLAVGAGISKGAGMPDWNTLVIHLIKDALRHGTPEHRRQLMETWRADSNNHIVINVEGKAFCFFKEEEDWEEKALKALEGLHPAPAETRAKLENARCVLEAKQPIRSAALLEAAEAVRDVFGERLLHHVQSALFDRTLYRTKVHPAIARMVRPRNKQSGQLTPRVFGILTYNFDDLLETAIRESGQEFMVHLSRAGESGAFRLGKPFGHPDRPSAVDIYHVHGFVPAPKGAFGLLAVDDFDLVFSEAQYRAHYGTETSWTKELQSGLFRAAPTLFIGSSLNDDESVAQLSEAHRQRRGWFKYAVLPLPDHVKDRKAPLTGEELEQLAAPYRKLGLHVLWISDWDEIPEILDAISEDGAEEATDHVRFPIHLLRADADPSAAVDLGIFLAQNGEKTAAISTFDQVIVSGPAALAAKALYNKGVALGALNRSEEAIVAYDEAIAAYDEVILRHGEATEPCPREQIAAALVNKGVRLGALNRSQEGIAAYDELIRRYGEADEPGLREWVAGALFNKGLALGALNRLEEAIAAYDELIQRYGKAITPALRKHVADALFNKGWVLGALNRSEDAIAVYDELIQRYGETTEPGLCELVASALFRKGFALGALNRSEEAIAAYDELIKRYGKATKPGPREQIAAGLFNKGVRLGALNRWEEAIVAYDELIRRYGEATEPGLREWVASALFNKGVTLRVLDRSEEAIAVYDELIRRYGEATEPDLRERVAGALFNKGVRLGALDRSEEAIAAYDELIRRYGEATEPGLREQVAKARAARS